MTRTFLAMGIISTILNLFGCSGQTKKDDSKLSKEMEEQLANSVEAFKNRPIIAGYIWFIQPVGKR